MEYIKGINFISFFETSAARDFEVLTEQIISFLQLLSDTKENKNLSENLFIDKINSILLSQSSCSADYITIEKIQSIGDFLLQKDWTAIPATISHGDLTLENIINNNNKIYFIDTLDGELSSYWLDIAKLYQDLISFWYLRNLSKNSKTSVRIRAIKIISLHFRRKLEAELYKNWSEVFDYLNQLVMLQLFRIVPYCKDEDTLYYVLDKINELKEEKVNCLIS